MRIGTQARRVALGIGLAGTLALTGAAFAGTHGHRGGHGPDFAKHLEALDLEDGQREAVQELLEQAREVREQGHQAMRSEHERLRELLAVEQPNREAVLEQAEVLGALRTEQSKARLETMLAVRAELTTEQWQQLRERRHERRGKRGDERRWHRGKRGHGDAPGTDELEEAL